MKDDTDDCWPDMEDIYGSEYYPSEEEGNAILAEKDRKLMEKIKAEEKKKKEEQKKKIPKAIPTVPKNDMKEGARGEEKKVILSTKTKKFLEGAIFFRIGFEPYVLFDVDGHNEIWRMDTDKFKKYYRARKMKELGNKYKERDINDELGRKIGEVSVEAKEYKLYTRLAPGEGGNEKEICYDLTNTRWEIVRILPHHDGQGWKVTGVDLPIFRRWGHEEPQIYPKNGINIEEATKNIRKLFHSKDNEKGIIRQESDDDIILYTINLITKFIPDIEQVIDLITGPAGSAKSVVQEINKRIIDPSKAISFGAPERYDKELILKIEQHWYCCFDNCNSIFPNPVSDLFSRCSTGGYESKRKLFTDSESILSEIKRCISITAISNPFPITKSDTLSRVVQFKMRLIENKIEPNIIMTRLGSWKSDILGSIFTILSKAMYIKKDIKYPPIKQRMVNYVKWGYAIAEVMNIGGTKFVNIYEENLRNMNLEVLQTDNVAILIKYMLNNVDDRFKGTMTDLHNYLTGHIATSYIEVTKDQSIMWDFPNTPDKLGRRIAQLEPNFKDIGVWINRKFDRTDPSDPTRKERIIEIRYLE